LAPHSAGSVNGHVTSALHVHFSAPTAPMQSHASSHPQPSGGSSIQVSLSIGHIIVSSHPHVLSSWHTHCSKQVQPVVG